MRPAGYFSIIQLSNSRFAPADEPKIALSVIVESSGTGSEYAVPIAKKMFESYLN